MRKGENDAHAPGGAAPEAIDDTHAAAERVVRCRACGHAVTKRTARIEVDGAHVHERANPSGFLYRIGCFREAPGCGSGGEASTFFSWFPGFAWQLALCAGCGVHLGWSFRRGDSAFFGLILERLHEE